MRRAGLTLLLGAVLTACDARLPEPESPGAQVYRARCGGCHRLYAPGAMTAEMWRFQMQRMRALYAQQGLAWLAPDEDRVLMEYLARFSGSGA